MKTDGEIRDDVIEELPWDPQITDPDAIGSRWRRAGSTTRRRTPRLRPGRRALTGQDTTR
jgi:hypothetical protein